MRRQPIQKYLLGLGRGDEAEAKEAGATGDAAERADDVVRDEDDRNDLFGSDMSEDGSLIKI